MEEKGRKCVEKFLRREKIFAVFMGRPVNEITAQMSLEAIVIALCYTPGNIFPRKIDRGRKKMPVFISENY